jgi:hypothetical protein
MGNSNWWEFPISHGYITNYQGAGTDTPHYADDIATPFHTVLTAPTSGTVLRADYQSWGGEIFVQPDDKSLPQWYMYHPDEVEVHAGQHVAAGQAIALSGGENPGYPGAEHPADPMWSTGPHTHVGWWTEWINTPDGVRPYGPDPANLIDMAAHGGGGTAAASLVPGDIYNAVEPYAQQQHVPDALWETVASMESSFNPSATNSSSGNAAVGLFQLLEGAGQGAGYTTAQLQDPGTNARIAMPYIASAWRNLSPSFDANSLAWWEEFAAQSGHPGGSPGNAYTDQVAQTMMSEYQQFAHSSPTATLSDTSSNAAQCTPPAWNDLTGWPGYWACLAQQSAAGSAGQLQASIAGWIGATIGPFMLRLGVGLVGVACIWIGINEIKSALSNKDDGVTVTESHDSKPKESKPEKEKKEKESKPEKEKKEKESKPEKEKKEKESKPEPKGEGAGEGAGVASKAGEGAGEGAGETAEMAAAAV